MRNTIKAILTIAMLLTISTILFSQESEDLDNNGVYINIAEGSKLFGMAFRTAAYESVDSFTDGTINRYSDNPHNRTNLGKFIEIKTQENNEDFFLIYAMLSEINSEINNTSTINAGDFIGKTGPTGEISKIFIDANIVIAVYTFEKNPKLERIIGSQSFYQFGVYWYDPSFVLNREIAKNSEEDYDVDRYSKIEIDDFLELFNKSPGFTQYGPTLLNMPISIQEMPTPIERHDREKIKKVYEYADNTQYQNIDLYQHKMLVTYPSPADYSEKCTISIFIQSDLVPFIENEYVVGSEMYINYLMSYIDTFRQETSILVTGIGYR